VAESRPERAVSEPAVWRRGKIASTWSSSEPAKVSVPKRSGAPVASGEVDEAIEAVTIVTRALPLPGAPTVVVCYRGYTIDTVKWLVWGFDGLAQGTQDTIYTGSGHSEHPSPVSGRSNYVAELKRSYRGEYKRVERGRPAPKSL
jgi:hypothetical protein